MTVRRQVNQRVGADCKDAEYAMITNRHRLVPLWVVFCVWNIRLVSKIAIPKAAMVGAHVSDFVERPKPGLQNLVANVEDASDVVFDFL